MFLLSISLFAHLPFAWWWWLVWILAPDLSMLAYLGGNKIGAIGYNFVHHKGIAIVVYLTGVYTNNVYLSFAGLILFGHSCMDRGMGYGLKYFSGFQDTHLGKIGRGAIATEKARGIHGSKGASI